MAAEILRTRYGRAATEALADAVRDLQAGDPLAPVAIVVTDHASGLMVRRRLATRAGGLAAVDVITLLDLARSASAGSVELGDRQPVSDSVVLAAARRLLAERPGAFAAVADHPSVERSVVATHRRLREVHPEAQDRLAAGGGVMAEVVALHRTLIERVGKRFHDERERADVAAALLTDGSATVPPVVLHLPGDLTASERRLVAALAGATRMVAIAGDADAPDGTVSADPHLEALAAALGVDVPDPGPTGSRAPCRVASVPDQEEAARHAVRRIVAAAHDGTPLDHMVLVHPSTTDDARLVHERLESAGIPFHAGGVRRLDETIPGRFLVGLLSLADRDLHRSDIEAWIASVPLWDPDADVVPSRAWARLAARAGVMAGVDDWTDRLERLASELDAEAEAEADDEGRSWTMATLSAEAARARALASFVVRLDSSLGELASDGSWSGRCRRVRDLLRRHLGGEAARVDWPPEEVRALDEVRAALDGLAELDSVEPDPPMASFQGALATELARPLGRAGRTGVGVQVVGIDQAIGLDADLVVVVGLTEGSMPTRAPADPLLTDARRTEARTGLPTRRDHATRQHHAFLAALTAADEQIVLVQTRGDLRKSGDRPMSRYLLAEFEALGGYRPEPDGLHQVDEDWFDHVASFTHALDGDDPATVQEYDLAVAVRGGPTAVDALRATDPVADRGIEMHRARASTALTRFDGNLAGVDLDLLGGDLSASRLETWVRCPFAFFSRYVLRVHPFEEPRERTDLAPMVRGSIVHKALQRLVDECLANGTLPAPGAPWTDDHRARGIELLDEECGHADARGEAPHPRFRSTVRSRLAAQMDDFLVVDSGFRAGLGTTPVAAEWAFGGDNALVVTLDDGRVLRFRGSVDRLDRTVDGELVVVDAKTGNPERYKGIPKERFPGGDHLQLPIYALAVTEDDRPARHATYAFFGDVASTERHLGYDVDDDVLAAFRRLLASAVDGIEGGAFPHHPPNDDRVGVHRCAHCSPDGLDARQLRIARERKGADPVLVLHDQHLTEDFSDDDSDGDGDGDGL
ncbi:MAG: PD-(D/E)XK nuclease family protein [Actinomycetota bacterium]|nr:PD-(D/E)XK nuclease family protein [Actinomycetota bacterium]